MEERGKCSSDRDTEEFLKYFKLSGYTMVLEIYISGRWYSKVLLKFLMAKVPNYYNIIKSTSIASVVKSETHLLGIHSLFSLIGCCATILLTCSNSELSQSMAIFYSPDVRHQRLLLLPYFSCYILIFAIRFCTQSKNLMATFTVHT